jgi:hypothetical protein
VGVDPHQLALHRDGVAGEGDGGRCGGRGRVARAAGCSAANGARTSAAPAAQAAILVFKGMLDAPSEKRWANPREYRDTHRTKFHGGGHRCGHHRPRQMHIRRPPTRLDDATGVTPTICFTRRNSGTILTGDRGPVNGWSAIWSVFFRMPLLSHLRVTRRPAGARSTVELPGGFTGDRVPLSPGRLLASPR